MISAFSAFTDPDFTIRQGTTEPPIRATLRDDDGTVPALQTGTQVFLRMARGIGKHYEFEFTASVIAGNEELPDDTELPNVEYQWQTTDLDPDVDDSLDVGIYHCYWYVIFPDLVPASFPSSKEGFTIEVTAE
jgi:hypothetical protein